MVHFNEKFKVENVDFLKFQRVTKSTQSSIDFTHFAGNSIQNTVKRIHGKLLIIYNGAMNDNI